MDDETDFSMKLSALYLKMAFKRAETKEKRRFVFVGSHMNITCEGGICAIASTPYSCPQELPIMSRGKTLTANGFSGLTASLWRRLVCLISTGSNSLPTTHDLTQLPGGPFKI